MTDKNTSKITAYRIRGWCNCAFTITVEDADSPAQAEEIAVNRLRAQGRTESVDIKETTVIHT